MTPPLRVWRNAMIFVIGAVVYMWIYFMGNDSPSSQTAIHYQEKIKAFHRTGKDTTTVIFLGSSLALNAFGDVPDVVLNCRPVKILRLNINGLTMEGVQAFKILETLSDFPPNYLFFESNLLIRFTKESSQMRFNWVYNMLFLRSNPMSLLHRDNLDMRKKIEILGRNLNPLYFDDKKDGIYGKLRANVNYKLIEDENYVVDKPFKKLISNHCKIILFKYPVTETPSYKNILPPFSEKVEQYKKDYGVVSWEIPQDQIQDSFFSDGAHMNHLGSRVFMRWFSLRLNQELCNN